MIDIFRNPEFVRNARIQLRPTRVLIVPVICAVVSVVSGISFAHAYRESFNKSLWAIEFLHFVVLTQAFVLAAWGGILCLHSIQGEKDRNTFDFQRLTRLSPWDLAVGKLFGAPVMAYFITLCLLPAAFVGAILAKVPLIVFLVAMLILFVGTLPIHAIALFVSLLIQRRAASVAVLGFLLVVLVSSLPVWNPNARFLSSIGPFSAAEFVVAGARSVVFEFVVQNSGSPFRVPLGQAANHSGWGYMLSVLSDRFFRHLINHLYLLFVVSLSMAGWFLLAVKRNIKRDPADYEYFTPLQLLGLLFYVSFLALGFYFWDSGPAANLEALHSVYILVFYALGLGLLRNRDRTRRLLREQGATKASWFSALWPAGYVITGAAVVEVGTHVANSNLSVQSGPWDAGLASFTSVFFVLWITRDILFLQWMNLRRGKNQMVFAGVYLLVFYGSTTMLFSTFGLFYDPRTLPLTAVFVPSILPNFDIASWNQNPGWWIFALAMQAAAAVVFAMLQKRELDGIVSRPAPSELIATD